MGAGRGGLLHGLMLGTTALLFVGGLPMPRAETEEDPIVALEASLPASAREALPLIAEGGRRLLALRGYLRSERSLEERWSWTEEEIKVYAKSPEYAAALQDIDKVRKAFEQANAGYTLRVNSEVRSLNEQIDRWNRNASVEVAAGELMDDFDQWIAAKPDATSAAMRNFLSVWRPSRPVSLATPGLSPHGRARAFDFQVQRGSEIIAGADTKAVSEIWEKEGWAGRLKAAVKASGAPFVGPLERPPEPWHYDYQPGDVASGKDAARGTTTTAAPDSQTPPIPRPRPSL